MSICTEKRSFWNCVIAGKNCALCGKKWRLPSNKPNIRQLLWRGTAFWHECPCGSRGSDCTGRIAGVCHLSGNAGRPHAVGEMRVPYQCRLEIPEASPDMVSYLTADPGAIRCSVQADADGEERVILAEADIPIRMWLYRDISKNQLEDVYSLEKQLIPKRKPVKIRKLHMKNESQCRVNDTLR